MIENNLKTESNIKNIRQTERKISLRHSEGAEKISGKIITGAKRIILAVSLCTAPIMLGGTSREVEAAEELPPFISGSGEVLRIPSRADDCDCLIQTGSDCNPGMKMGEIGVCFENRWSWPSGCKTDVPCDKGASWMCFCP